MPREPLGGPRVVGGEQPPSSYEQPPLHITDAGIGTMITGDLPAGENP